jgi:hypothetical protein
MMLTHARLMAPTGVWNGRAALRALALALLALVATGAVAQAAPPPNKTDTQIDELTVTGQRRDKDPGAAVRDYVTTYTGRSPIDRVSRWDERICPGVIGLKAPAALAVIDRVREVAKAAGATVDPNEPCRPNIVVVFTREPQELMRYVGKKAPDILGYHYISQRKALTTVTHPIQAYYATATRDHNGVPHTDSTENEAEEMAVLPSRLKDDLSSVFQQVTVIVDTGKTTGMEVRSIADYVAMLALSQAKALDACSPLPSIRNLFLTDCDPTRRTTALSDTDAAYLHALYDMSKGLVGPAQRSAIQFEMQRTPPAH